MFTVRSDLKERLPRFNEAVAAIEQTALEGGYEGVSPSVLNCLLGMEPVGLDDDRNVVLPRSYRPENGPPVLMQLDRESNTAPINLLSPPAEQRAARRMAERMGGPISKTEAGSLDITFDGFTPTASVYLTRTTVEPDSGEQYTLRMPRLLVVNAAASRLGSVTIHEADHWDFLMNTLPQLGTDQPDSQTVRAISEKRAYFTSHKVEANLGHYDGVDDAGALARRYAYLDPQHAELLVCEIDRQCSRRGSTNYVSNPLAVLAMDRLFGKPDEAVTPEEMTAYYVMGIA